MTNKYFWKDGRAFAFSPLQVTEGCAQGLKELTEEEVQAHLNPHKTLQELASAAMSQVNAEYTKRIGFITAEYPAEEIASFDKQVIQAERYLSGETTRVGWLLTCAKGRGMTAEQLATRILELDAAFEVEHARLTAVRQNHEKAIQELLAAGEESRADLENYWYLEGWEVEPTTDLQTPQPA